MGLQNGDVELHAQNPQAPRAPVRGGPGGVWSRAPGLPCGLSAWCVQPRVRRVQTWPGAMHGAVFPPQQGRGGPAWPSPPLRSIDRLQRRPYLLRTEGLVAGQDEGVWSGGGRPPSCGDLDGGSGAVPPPGHAGGGHHRAGAWGRVPCLDAAPGPTSCTEIRGHSISQLGKTNGKNLGICSPLVTD